MILSENFKIYVLGLLIITHLLLSFFIIIPGYISIDEITYFLMVKHFSESGELTIWNGYQEYQSTELILPQTIVRNGKLIPQYPYLFAILNSLFYRIWGYGGLFVINIVAFPGIVLLVYTIAQKLFCDRNLSLNACLILILATFIWEYSQAAWPHMTTTFFITAAFYLYIRSLYAETGQASLAFALAAGGIIGFATGLRLDVFFILPCFLLPCLVLKPYRYRQALGLCLGTLPGLALLSVTNSIKFGVFSPLSYGGTIPLTRYLPFLGVSAIVFVGLWGLTRYPVMTRLWQYKRLAIAMAILLTGALAMIPQVRSMIRKGGHGTYQILVDFRTRDRSINEPSLSRSRGGGMIYMNGLKKSLLQSCPYLVLVVLPFLHVLRRGGRDTPPYPPQGGNTPPYPLQRRKHTLRFFKEKPSFQEGNVPTPDLFLLFLIPITFTGFYGYHAWHGGLGWNLRYLIPILPFTSILCAYAWRDLNDGQNWRNKVYHLALPGFFIVAFYLFFLRPFFRTVEQQEFLYLTLPLSLAGMLLVLVVLREIFIATEPRHREQSFAVWDGVSTSPITPLSKRGKSIIGNLSKKGGQITLIICFVTMVWAGVVALGYDYPLARHARVDSLHVAEQALNYITDDAILSTTFPNAFFCLAQYRRIRIANPARDNFQDFPTLLMFHIKAGHAVYGAFPSWQWAEIRRRGLLDPRQFKVVPLKFFDQILCRITIKLENTNQ